MGLDKSKVLMEMDQLLQRTSQQIRGCQFGDCSDLSDDLITELNSLLLNTIDRFAPPNSSYRSNAKNHIEKYQIHNGFNLKTLLGILKSLREDVQNDRLLSVQELIHGEIFSDFLDMSQHLNEEGYKDAAAVLAGGTLEGHLKKLCDKNGISTNKADGSNKKADTINSELSAANVVTKLDQKNITSWLGLRNDAAHGDYSKYTKEQVTLFIASIRDFISRVPA